MGKLPKNFDKNSDGWVKCSERNPDKGGKYNIIDPNDICYDKRGSAFYYMYDKSWEDGAGNEIHPTHWRELPAPPKD